MCRQASSIAELSPAQKENIASMQTHAHYVRGKEKKSSCAGGPLQEF